ncbi:hypothetical protein ASPZODRAFT_128763 [Penicilliopsis zonata CBS 506.65]|uniref:Barwin domain-containing protein n=1 Tax=Penicilliopsis zonata CBS 506.65 TaxID=1073090 RepID=A0A1L9SSP4_9EURO|nr:hypothetical protein ASPZODRAFT_128763 [Penicilliopsis zonata CBS 506.65]OJJ50143.1 hypothetical protein ASPZODRAFT_128763 [Penicilliopsis zonata CBS 506.65]
MFASTLLFALGASASSSIYSGSGFGTYYYDISDVDACGTSFSSQNLGDVECSQVTALSLDTINSNYLVAMNHTQLVDNMETYCGKRVVVTINGVKSDLPLFIGDGCERCAEGSADSDTWNAEGAPGLDFSYTVLNELSGGEACDDGHVSIEWEILDETLYEFDTGASDSSTSQGPVSAAVTASASATASTFTA